MLYLGIYPNINKSGIAYKQDDDIKLHNLTFFEIYDYLTFVKNNFIDVLVVIRYKKPNVEKGAFGVTYYQGMNHQNGKLMIDMCKHIDIPYTTVKGPKKRLKTHDDFIKRTGLTQFKQSNIEQRKAYMLIHNRE